MPIFFFENLNRVARPAGIWPNDLSAVDNEHSFVWSRIFIFSTDKGSYFLVLLLQPSLDLIEQHADISHLLRVDAVVSPRISPFIHKNQSVGDEIVQSLFNFC